MSYTVVTTKIDLETKHEAQMIAQELGVPLSVIIKAFLKQFIRTKSITFSVNDDTPNTYLQNSLLRAEENYKQGKASPRLRTPEEAVKYLEDQEP